MRFAMGLRALANRIAVVLGLIFTSTKPALRMARMNCAEPISCGYFLLQCCR